MLQSVWRPACLGLVFLLFFQHTSFGSRPDSLQRPAWAAKKGPYRPTRLLKNDIIHTKLQLRFDWLRQHVLGTATIAFKPYFYAQNTLELDAKGFDIKSVVQLDTLNRYDSTQQKTITEFVADTLEYTYNRRTLNLKLRRSYSRFDTLHVQIDYVAKPNELPEDLRGVDTKGLYFINADGLETNKPRQIWTQGETENNSCWFPTVDSPNEKMTQEVFITVDNQYRTLSNGLLIDSKTNPDSTRTDYWRQRLPHAPYLTMIAVGDFALLRDSTASGLPLEYYVEPEYASHAQAIFGRTREMMSFFEKTFGVKYAWEKYAQICVRDFVSGAMENTTATVHGEDVQMDSRALTDGNSDDIIAHELSHHWFGNLVTCEEWGQLPLNEAFANYSEYLWNEHKHGVLEADRLAQGEMNQYLGEAETKQEPLIRFFYADKENMFDNHSYAKGGRVLHMLRRYLGDDAFFLSMKLYLEKNKFKTAEIPDLRTAVEEVTGQDMNWFFDQWFMRAGHPNLKIENSYDPKSSKVVLKISQLQDSTYTPIYKLPLKIDVWVKGQRQRYDVTVNRARQTFEFPAAERPDLVDFDAEKQLLAVIDYKKTKQELVFQYYNTDKYLTKYDAVTGLENQLADTTARKLMMDAMSDPFWRIRQLAIANFSEYDGMGFNQVERVLQSKARVDEKSAVRAEALITLASFGDNSNDPLFREALNDSSFMVVTSALDAYLISKPDDATEVTAKFETSPNNDIITAVANYYAGLAQPERYDWFLAKMERMKSAEYYNFLQVFGKYLVKSNQDIQRRALPLLETTARNHSAYFVRFGAYQVLGLLTDIEGVKAMRKDLRASEQDPKLREMYAQFRDF